jgi:hypothetical protein
VCDGSGDPSEANRYSRATSMLCNPLSPKSSPPPSIFHLDLVSKCWAERPSLRDVNEVRDLSSASVARDGLEQSRKWKRPKSTEQFSTESYRDPMS